MVYKRRRLYHRLHWPFRCNLLQAQSWFKYQLFNSGHPKIWLSIHFNWTRSNNSFH
jgi:hypothetical protein